MRRLGAIHWRVLGAAAAALATLALSAGALASAATSAAPPACATSGLVVWLNTEGNGAAGSSFYTLNFTNLSGHTCSLRGYPGVSAIDLAGRQIGSPAGRDSGGGPGRLVTLRNGHAASATLRIVDALNFPNSRCRLASAAGLRVYPPGQTASKAVPFPFDACARTGTIYLSIRSVQ
ncbi:MAG: DUF4232 domain-containing protein [Solirubrobacteraceae bacterium]